MSKHNIKPLNVDKQNDLAVQTALQLLKQHREMSSNNDSLKSLEEFEDRIVGKICVEIKKLRDSWEEKKCVCGNIDKTKFAELQAEYNALKEEFQKSEEEKLKLMNQLKGLEDKLRTEKEFRCQLSGMLSSDIYNEDKITKDGTDTEVIDIGFTDDDSDVETIITTNARAKSETRSDKTRRSKDRKSSTESSRKRRKESGRSSRKSSRSSKKRTRSCSRTSSSSTRKLKRVSSRIEAPKVIPLSELAFEIEERKTRKNNVILKGFKVTDRNNIGADIIQLITDTTRVTPQMKRLSELDDGNFLLELTSLDNKLKIMARRHELKSMGMKLQNDFTEREIQVQHWLEYLAEQDTRLGKRAKVGYMKICRDGVWEIWNEHLGRLVFDGSTRVSLRDEGGVNCESDT